MSVDSYSSKPPDRYAGCDGISLVSEYALLDVRKRELLMEVERIKTMQALIETTIIAKSGEDGILRYSDASDNAIMIRDDIRVSYPKRSDPEHKSFEIRMKELGLLEKVSSINWVSFRSLARRANWLTDLPEALSGLVNVESIKLVKFEKKR
ncbi:MAG: hypothetical protein ABIE74_01735 [Pseudomonadota bacterium]